MMMMMMMMITLLTIDISMDSPAVQCNAPALALDSPKNNLNRYLSSSFLSFLLAGGCNQSEIRDDFLRVFSLSGTRLAAAVYTYRYILFKMWFHVQ